jgi:hypothetical protein
MVHLMIERLRLRLEPGAGHEHRIGPIARRAAMIFAERLHERLGLEPPPAPARVDQLVGEPVRLDLSRMSDDAAAGRIAGAWLAALAPARQRSPEFGVDRLEPARGAEPSA